MLKIKNLLAATGMLTLIMVGFLALNSFTTAEEEESILEKLLSLPQQIHAIPHQDRVVFAGETIPMNVDTRERLDRELTVNSYYHSSTLLNLKLAAKYFPILEPILREQGVPDDFKYLAVAESGLRNAVSPAGARGLWQIMRGTAKDLGLEVNKEVDERYHVEKATVAACKYIKRLHKRFGSWTLASAAYNMGPTNLSKALKQQKTNSYFDLNINQETSRYVFRLAALKQIMERPSDFGFHIQESEKYESLDNTYQVEVNKSISNWADFAGDHGISYKILKYYNPWLRDSKLTVKNNTYLVKIPRRS